MSQPITSNDFTTTRGTFFYPIYPFSISFISFVLSNLSFIHFLYFFFSIQFILYPFPISFFQSNLSFIPSIYLFYLLPLPLERQPKASPPTPPHPTPPPSSLPPARPFTASIHFYRHRAHLSRLNQLLSPGTHPIHHLFSVSVFVSRS